jgi:hypothetical protein
MDEKLKNQVMISIIGGGIPLMLYQFLIADGSFLSIFLAVLIGLVFGGATFGIMYFIQKDQ